MINDLTKHSKVHTRFVHEFSLVIQLGTVRKTNVKELHFVMAKQVLCSSITWLIGLSQSLNRTSQSSLQVRMGRPWALHGRKAYWQISDLIIPTHHPSFDSILSTMPINFSTISSVFSIPNLLSTKRGVSLYFNIVLLNEPRHKSLLYTSQ